MSVSQQNPFDQRSAFHPQDAGQLDQNTPLRTRPLVRPAAGRSRHNLFLNLPIAWRLALGFLVAALVAALASGVAGIQRSQSLSKQTEFYHTLLQLNTSLTTGRSFLELMDAKLHQTLDDANASHPSRETLNADSAALNNLANLYDGTLNTYAHSDLLGQHPDQLNLLAESGDDSLASQQLTLTDSAQRTWLVYRAAQEEVLSDLVHNQVKNAQLTLQQQGEPTNADALSAMRSLLQLNDRLASAVDSATNVEIHNQFLTTLLAIAGAFLAIALVGWFISDTLIRRLRHLRYVTRAIENGHIDERVQVVGRDEIADVSVAVNSMVTTIVGLFEETRKQRDALTGAAEHLFSDMRIVNAGDLRVSAIVSNDPIGMLANAFNFTVGRFRRFILRTSTTIEQLDVMSQQGLERTNAFTALARTQLRDHSVPSSHPSPQAAPPKPWQMPITGSLRSGTHKSGSERETSFVRQIQQVQDIVLQTTRADLQQRLNGSYETTAKAGLAIGRLSELISTRSGNVTERMIQAQLQELVVLEQLFNRLTWEIRQLQSSTANHVMKIDEAFTELAHAAEHAFPETAALPEPGPSVAELQYLEFVQQAGSFSVEVNALFKRLTIIIQEMRASTLPFRLEGGASMGEFARAAAGFAPVSQPLSADAASNLTSA